MTPEEFRDHLRSATNKAGGVAAWAKAHGLTRQYVSNVINKPDVPPSKRILDALGLTVATEYETVKPPRPGPPGLTDCSREDNRIDARWELDRATTTGALARWASKWGRALLDGYGGYPPFGAIEHDIQQPIKRTRK